MDVLQDNVDTRVSILQHAQHTRYCGIPHVYLALGELKTSLADLCKHIKTSAVNLRRSMSAIDLFMYFGNLSRHGDINQGIRRLVYIFYRVKSTSRREDVDFFTSIISTG